MTLYNTKILRYELSAELLNIIDYWQKFSPDEENGGFVGQRNHDNKLVPNASKGIILNTRILWTFSAYTKNSKDKISSQYAKRAFHYLINYFKDQKFKGFYWELDAEGSVINKRKQIYAQAFAIYALSEYYLISKDNSAITEALEIFKLIEENAFDHVNKGYFEAFDRNWKPIADMRLSEKDLNASKTMNTHLHLLEAYTTLYTVTNKPEVKKALEQLINLFLTHFYNPENQHFKLFFDNDWNNLDRKISYGHDIEAIWLLIEAAKAINNNGLLKRVQSISGPVADTFIKEAVTSNGVINEHDLATGHTDTDKHWWPQAEAMLGLYYAFQNSPKPEYLNAIYQIWDFTKKNIIDHQNGEWFFRVDNKNTPYSSEDKLGMWKCPYHNSRACMILLEKMP
ncbi:cellobiose 2-epimerase [Marivirga lumbricoides]|uniref:Cellobiose 2-epimerase n=1 Tax=Marivirga lumbricoides TaxID=1046115 RepID=A0ABQ1M1I8_9BACT|nr:cellobiose 2-epimerase [Marivirga lumbricoides]